ncbi:MAG: adenylosuccinate synthetase [Elusimicrobiales bacterium]|nr:adenylosuccinate synthetase [Elusimicrobiales bacterium]
MPVDIIVGGQAGDEGKGKISAYLSYKGAYSHCVRVGGPNAGHTVVFRGAKYTLKSISSGFLNPKTKIVLGAGAYIITDWLLKEIQLVGAEDRLLIDPRAVIIEPRHMEAERADSHFMTAVGSVGTGLGQAVRERIERKELKFATDEPALSRYIADVPDILNRALNDGSDVLLEGTQGVKLSLLHGEYPFVTSRDTTAATFMAEAGMGPKAVRDVYAVFKPYVTRVGPGPLERELTDKAALSKYHTQGNEVGSVSGRLRRVGAFESDWAKKTVIFNSVTKLAVTHIDMFEGNTGVRELGSLTKEARGFLDELSQLGKLYPHPKLAFVSSGPELEDMLDLRY